jgi:maltoporin
MFFNTRWSVSLAALTAFGSFTGWAADSSVSTPTNANSPVVSSSVLPTVSPAVVEEDGGFVGYLRVGAGVSTSGGTQDCYYLGNGNGHGYRLGNECDSYTELGYSKTLLKSDDGIRFVGHFMITDYSGNSAYSGNVQISQIFISVVGLEGLNGGTPWLGERFYERPDIHWMDLQYINLNGTGGGIDNIDTAWGGKFSYAVFKDNDTNNYSGTSFSSFSSSNAAIRNDFLYRNLPVNAGGSLDAIVGLILPTSPSDDRHKGYNLHVFHKQSILGGGNLFGVQYGMGPGTGEGTPTQFDPSQPTSAFGSTGGVGPNAICCNRMGQSGSTLLGPEDTRLRIFDAIWIQPTPRFSAAFDLLYEADKFPVYGGISSWESMGVRPEYAFTRHFKLQGEIGIDRVTYPEAPTENLIKYTLAPTLTLGPGFFDRPELRLFVTRANWNSAAIATVNANNVTNTASIGQTTSDTSFGIQLEAWWGKNWF